MVSSWTSVLIGASLGTGYGIAGLVMNRLALRFEQRRFLALCLGGMMLRMVAMLVAVSATLFFVSVRPMPFAVALVATLLGGLAVEVVALHRAQAGRS